MISPIINEKGGIGQKTARTGCIRYSQSSPNIIAIVNKVTHSSFNDYSSFIEGEYIYDMTERTPGRKWHNQNTPGVYFLQNLQYRWGINV